MIDLDDQLLKELKPIHDEIRKNEASVSDDDKDHFENGIKDLAKHIFQLSDIARKEGLLALEEFKCSLDDEPWYTPVKELIELIVDGNDPEMVKRISLMRYYSTLQEPYMKLMNIMSIYGFISIQTGENPKLIMKMLESLAGINIGTAQRDAKEDAYPMIDIDRFYSEEIGLTETDIGFYEVSVCDRLIKVLDNRALQRVIRDVEYRTLGQLMIGLSGEARRRIIGNVSKGIGEMLIRQVECYISVTGTFSRSVLNFVKSSAIIVLQIISKLNYTGEIVIALEPEDSFLRMILMQINSFERSRRGKAQDCNLLIGMIENYKRTI